MKIVFAGVFVMLAALPALAEGSFTLTSPAFADNDMLAAKYAAKGGPQMCDGENVSPPLAWENPPANTASFALLVEDQVGRYGLGVTHLVAYGLPADATGVAEGALNGDAGFVGGKNTLGLTKWFGPCPDVGDAPHHYEFTLIATDLAPDALAPGMDRDALLKSLADHAVGATSLVARYAR